MEQEKSIEKVKELYDSGNLPAAAEMAMELHKAGISPKEAYLYQVLVFTRSMPPLAKQTEAQKTLYHKSYSNVLNDTESFKEYQEKSAIMDEAFNLWEYEQKCKDLPKYGEDSDLVAKRAQDDVSYCFFNGLAAMYAGNKRKELEEKEGITFSEAQKIYPRNAKKYELEYKEAFYKAGCDIFEQGCAVFEENCDASAEYVKSVFSKCLKQLTNSYLVVDSTIPEDDGELTKDVLIERLAKTVEIRTYILNAMMYPNGQPMSLMQGKGPRNNLIKEIKQANDRIERLNPGYVAPPLPSPEAITLPVSRSSSSASSAATASSSPSPASSATSSSPSSSSGGCYVATAVYGSYDCPQVWTLRRYRDYTLAETWYGRAFIHTYYAVSPTLVKWFGDTQWFKNMWKPTLDRMVKNLRAEGVEDTPYEDKMW